MNRRGFLARATAANLALWTLDGKALKAALTPPAVPVAPVVAGSDCFIPELWARESMRILQENMVMGNLVQRDFTDQLKSFDDKVNVCRPH